MYKSVDNKYFEIGQGEALGKSISLLLVYPYTPPTQTFRTLPRHLGGYFFVYNLVLNTILEKCKPHEFKV